MICRKCRKEIPESSRYCNFCGIIQQVPAHRPKKRGNGTGTVVKLPNGKYKAIVVLDYFRKENGKMGRRLATKTFEKKSDAVAALPSLRQNRPANERISVGELHELFLQTPAYQQLSKSQQDKLGFAWKRLKGLEKVSIADLSVQQMQDTIDSQVQTYYPARDMKVMLSHLYELAKKREYVTYNKTENLDLPPQKKAKKDSFTETEVQIFWQDYQQGNLFTGYILTLLYTGMRYGELAKIRLEDIHLDELYMQGGIKSEAGKDRIIPFGQKLVPVLEKLMEGKKSKLLEMNEDNWYKFYWETTDRLGIRRLNPHCCRHTWFTRASAAGIPPALIAAAGGHADISVAYKNYIHTPTKELIEAAQKI